MADTDTDRSSVVREQILEALRRAGGAISFAQFMSLALYSPGVGYYEREAARVGKAGDFITSVSVGPLFGELLAAQFAEWLQKNEPTPARLALVECGAHDGKLARDILGALQRRAPEIYARVDYWSVENSLTRQAWQQQTLSAHSGRLNWVKSMAELPRNLDGVFYSNELLDAFPVVRVVWHASALQWVEMGVGLQGDEWNWVPLRPVALETVSDWLALPLPPELLAVFPDGFTLDLIPEAARWWSEAAGTLRRGYLVAFDYGAEADELVSPRYARGTLRGYCRQRVVDRVLATPGEIDLTAHVNWTALNAAGVGQGLQTEFSGTQRQFLTEILTRRIQETGAGGLGWGPGEVRQFQTLTHPEHLGRAFRVLVQRR